MYEKEILQRVIYALDEETRKHAELIIKKALKDAEKRGREMERLGYWE